MKRALVTGSQIEGLKATHNDVRAMQQMLEARGFAVDVRVEEAATRDGILAGYDKLIADSRPGDAAVFYFAGHGFYGPVEDRSWQCIAPTDVRQGGPGDWRGISGWELSIKQAQLTERTRNVTVILDTCHSSQMSRAAVPGAIARGLPHPVKLGLDEHFAALRERYGRALDQLPPSNPDAVRLVACGQRESAWEYSNAAGEYRGAFTEALVAVLRDIGEAEVSWAALADAIRARVLRRSRRQRPEIEGPVRRAPFTLVEHDAGGVGIRAVGQEFRLSIGQITGALVGDVYAVVPVGSTPDAPSIEFARLEVTEVSATTSQARLVGGGDVPPDAVAVPVKRRAARRAVAVVADGDARVAIEQALASSPTLRPAEPDEPVVATLRLAGDALTVEDAHGPLFPPVSYASSLGDAIKDAGNLGLAQALRELAGEHGVAASELAIELGVVVDGQTVRLPDDDAELGLRDRLYLRVASRQRRLHLHVFNIGLRGKIALLTREAPAGVVVMPGEPPFVLGESPNGALDGLAVHWPRDLPTEPAPRCDELVMIATTAPADLRSLETREAVARGGAPDDFYLKLLSYQLHPRDEALAGRAPGA